MTAIVIGNDGPLIQTTNYYDSEAASRGLLYVSWHANAARVLVPDSQLAMVAEMKTGKECIVSAGPTERGLAYELLFEDHTDSPFSVTVDMRMSDRLIPASQQGGGFVVTVWTRHGQQLSLPGRYRKVKALPCLAPWGKH